MRCSTTFLALLPRKSCTLKEWFILQHRWICQMYVSLLVASAAVRSQVVDSLCCLVDLTEYCFISMGRNSVMLFLVSILVLKLYW